MLLVDGAHGSYLKFLNDSLFPTDLGADMCCSSAHKTLPVLTGGAYLHVKDEFLNLVNYSPKTAMSLFSSTSPSYLIMASLDRVNAYLNGEYKQKLQAVCKAVKTLKNALKKVGYSLVENEPLKLTLKTKNYGYSGVEFSKILEKSSVFCEFADEDFVVMMFSSETQLSDIERLKNVLLSIEKLPSLQTISFDVVRPKRKMSVRKALLKETQTLPIEKCENRVMGNLNVSCPPAVQIVCLGEVINKKAIEVLTYYGVKSCEIIK